MKPYLFPAILAAVLASGLRFLATGSAAAFAVTIVLVIVGVVVFIEYEIELANKESDYLLEEWALQQNQQDGIKLILTKSSIEREEERRRELISFWEKTA